MSAPRPRAAARVAVVIGDLTRLDVDALVNAANRTLLGGGGVDGALHRAAGPGLLEECRALGGCETGGARLTGGHGLRARHVIHAVGPVWSGGDRGEDGLLAACYRAALELALERRLATLAFPSISTGAYRFPKERAAGIAVDTTLAWLSAHELPEHVTFCCFSAEDAEIYRRVLGARPDAAG